MAKRKRNTKKKHNSDHQEHEENFLQSVPERSENDWNNGDDDDEEYYNPVEHPEEEVGPKMEEIREEPQPEIAAVDPIQEAMENHASSEEPEHMESIEGSEFSLGRYLREQRESQGISLKSVSQSTKINITNLEYLESDDLNALPNRAYVTGYVKSYSKLIGCDTNFCLKLLEKTYQSLGAKPREPEIVIPQAQNSPQMAEQTPVAKIGAIIAMLAVIGAIAVFFINRKNEGPELPVAEAPIEEEVKEIQPQTLNAETPLQEEITDEGEINSEEVATEEAEAIKEPLKVVEKKEEPKVVEVEKKKEEPKVVEEKKVEAKVEKKEEDSAEEDKRKFYPLTLPLYTVNKDITPEKLDELLPASSRVNVQDGQQAVYIKANKGDSWLTYKKDDEPIKKFVLKEGRSLLFVANEARLFLGNIGGVTIFLNNQPLKISSRTGVKSIVFPQENADKYVMPLFIYKDDGSVITSKEWIDENN